MNIIVPYSSNQLLNFGTLIALAPHSFWSARFQKEDGKLDIMGIAQTIIAECKDKGPFNPLKIRGRGVWLEGEREIINLGDPLPEGTNNIYLCFEPLPKIAHKGFDATRLLDLFKLFNWRNPQDAILLFGWLAIAPICGILEWRPHCFVHGLAKSGKSTLHHLCSRLLHPLAVAADGDSSEAGIRQTVGPDSLPVVIDEFESDKEKNQLASIIRLARSASSSNVPVLRGTPEGKALQFSLRCTFFFSAINPSGLRQADRTRIVQLVLDMHDFNPDTGAKIESEILHFEPMGPQWCGYMVDLASLINPSVALFRQHLTGHLDGRHRKNMAALLAGAFVALNKRIPSIEEVKEWAEEFSSSVTYHAEEHERDDSMECLEYLFSYLSHDTEKYTLGHWIGKEYEAVNGKITLDDCRESLKILGNYHIRVLDNTHPSCPNGFIIANTSPAIERIFHNSKWHGGAWQTAMRKIKGSKAPDHPQSFSGFGKHRCVWLPAELIPEAFMQNDDDIVPH